MKNELRLITMRTISSIRRIIHRSNFSLSACAILLALTFCTGCAPTDFTDKVDTSFIEGEAKTEKVHLAFAGGGWRAHTGHSAWTMSLLDDGKLKLDSVFSNVGTISSNSGGSWFSTMLMYSPAFIDSIQAPNAIESWSTLEGGWTGGQYDFFKTISCSSYHGDAYMPCILLKELPVRSEFWIEVTKEIVFTDFPIDESITLGDTTQPWAKDKPLLLAASMLTDEVVINDSLVSFWHPSENKNILYQACFDPHVPVLKGLTGAYCSGGDSAEVTPVTFSRVPENTSFLASPFFSQNSGQAVFNVGYKQNSISSRGVDTLLHTIIQGPLSTSAVPVIVAAAASSAATGFLASESISGIHAELLDREAISFKMINKTVEYAGLEVTGDLEYLQSNKVVSLADGGPVDNSGVAQLVSSLLHNAPAQDTFNIVAFDNVTSAYDTILSNSDTLEVGPDIAYLFGRGLEPGNKFCAEKKVGCITVPDLQIFDEAPLTNTAATWSYPGSNGEKLIYAKYVTTTKENSVFNVESGKTVILHAFTCVYPSAGTVPMNEKGANKLGFGVYGDMIKFINTGLNDGNGLIHLQRALGISK
jgi:hypothetical protein